MIMVFWFGSEIQKVIFFKKILWNSTYSRSNCDDKVSEAVGQMVSMGFTDEDGWLTQLCTLKKGNIEQVLDVLTPVKK